MTAQQSPSGLPIDAVLPELRAALAAGPNAVLVAPPGAGKTTVVPLALLSEPWLGGGRIVMLEPRRLAARAAANRMAAVLGEQVGERVGYRIRLDNRTGPRTRVEIVTEAILTRRLQRDPELAGVAAVIFDEFHERSLHADLGLALSLECQEAFRPDLRLLVMSATLDGERVAALLGKAPLIVSTGRSFPVDTRHAASIPQGRIEAAVADAVRRAVAEDSGSVLAFLPGEAEIRRAQADLAATLPADTTVHPLFGAMESAAQDAAIRPAPPGRRKVVLATNIAETSLTIDGVRIVVDCGLARRARFDPGAGMSRLETVRASRAAADQRRGRAGRTEPGVCYRLWPQAAEGGFPLHDTPEILDADLTPLALDLAQWGTAPGKLRWLDPPPAAALGHARDTLILLGAVDAAGQVTAHGRQMAALSLHPRLAHMAVLAAARGEGASGCLLAALLDEGDVRQRGGPRDADLRHRVEALVGGREAAGFDRKAMQRVQELARRWRRQLDIADAPADPAATGRLLALAFPDRVAQRRPGGGGRFLLANGKGAALPDDQPLAASPWLVVADMDAGGREGRVWLAAAVEQADIEAEFAADLVEREVVAWDGRRNQVVAERQRRLGAIVLAAEAMPLKGYEEAIGRALCDGIRSLGVAALPWDKDSDRLRRRIAFARRYCADAAPWPDVSDTGLLGALEEWLLPHLGGRRRLDDLVGLPLAAILAGLLDWPARQALDRVAPTHFEAPSGSRIPIDYAADPPVLAVRIQEMFGSRTHPVVADGRVPLVVHLLSPAHRPVQVTTDLPGFWHSSYADVRKDLRGRYPKHPWPDDPLAAEATNRVKRPK